MPGPTDNMAAIMASMQTPSGGQPGRLGGILPDVQMAPILSLKGFNIDNPIMRTGGQKAPTFFGKLLGDMGFSAENFKQSLSQVNQGGMIQQCSPADIYGHGLDTGGSFVSRIGISAGDGGHEIG